MRHALESNSGTQEKSPESVRKYAQPCSCIFGPTLTTMARARGRGRAADDRRSRAETTLIAPPQCFWHLPKNLLIHYRIAMGLRNGYRGGARQGLAHDDRENRDSEAGGRLPRRTRCPYRDRGPSLTRKRPGLHPRFLSSPLQGCGVGPPSSTRAHYRVILISAPKTGRRGEGRLSPCRRRGK